MNDPAGSTRKLRGGRRGLVSLRSLWATLGVTLLLVADVVLVSFALSESQRAPLPAAGDRPSPEVATTPRPDPTSIPTPTRIAVAQPRELAAIDRTSAWRLTPGTCDSESPVLESTNDGGATWQEHGTPGVALQAGYGFGAVSQDHVSVVVGLAPDCRVSVVASFTGGEFWAEYPDEVSGQDYLVDEQNVVLNGVALPAPCNPVLALDTGDTTVVAVCPDQVATANGSVTEWSTIEVGGVLDATVGASGVVVVTAADSACPALAIHTGDGSLVGCAPEELPVETVTLDAAGEALWLWSGDDVRVSLDGGATW